MGSLGTIAVSYLCKTEHCSMRPFIFNNKNFNEKSRQNAINMFFPFVFFKETVL